MKQLLLTIFLLSITCGIRADNRQHTIDSLLKCLPISSKIEKANIYNQLRKEYIFMGSNYTKALLYSLQSLKLYNELKMDSGVFILNGNISNIYFLQKDFKTALQYLNKANRYNKTDDYICYMYSIVYLNMNLFDSSLFYAKKCIEYSNNEDRIAYAMQDLGTVYEKKGVLDSAINWYLKSIKIFEKIKNYSGIREGYASLGDVYFSLKMFKKSLEYENKSLILSTNEDDLPSLSLTSLTLSKIYDSIGDCKNSYLFFKRYTVLKDSLINKKNIQETVRIEDDFRFEREKELAKADQDKKDEIKREELRHQKNQRNIFIGCFILVFCLSIFLFRLFKKNQKAKIEITKQKHIVDDKNKDILDSIRYSYRIQTAILPPKNIVSDILPEHLIYFSPKDIVSGDFYYVDKINSKILWGACDATGHGTGGALLSMLGVNILSSIMKDGETVPSKILDKLNEKLNESLHKNNDNAIRDGMDVAFCSLDLSIKELQYAGANNPLWILRKGEILETKADKMPIGQTDRISSYTNHIIQLQSGDCIYTFSDGICDLHSENNKKFMKKRFKELLISVQDKSMDEQKKIIEETLSIWKGKADQIDDILLIGVKI